MVSGPSRGMASTALAVSCAAGTITFVSASPETDEPVWSVPTHVPGTTTAGNRWVGNPRRSINDVAQRFVRMSKSPVVDAAVYSVTELPLSNR